MAFVGGGGVVRAVERRGVTCRRARRSTVSVAVSSVGSTAPEGDIGLAFKVYQTGDCDAANQLFERFVEQEPEAWRMWQKWGELESQYGAPSRAVEIMQQAVQRYPCRASLWISLAGLEAQRGNRREALKVYERSVEMAGKKPALLLPWALLEAEQGRVWRAREIFEMLVATSPCETNAYSLWGNMELNDACDPDAARAVFERGSRVCSNTSCIWLAWAQLEESVGNLEMAERLFCEAAMADPRNAAVWHDWGKMADRNGDSERAERLFEQGIVVAPNFGSLWLAWGQMMERMGNVEKAQSLYKRGARKNPHIAACCSGI